MRRIHLESGQLCHDIAEIDGRGGFTAKPTNDTKTFQRRRRGIIVAATRHKNQAPQERNRLGMCRSYGACGSMPCVSTKMSRLLRSQSLNLTAHSSTVTTPPKYCSLEACFSWISVARLQNLAVLLRIPPVVRSMFPANDELLQFED